MKKVVSDFSLLHQAKSQFCIQPGCWAFNIFVMSLEKSQGQHRGREQLLKIIL